MEETSFFVGPGRGRWTPTTWAELQQAITSGILNENAWVELKKDLPPSSSKKDGNVETARDLASLALDSGLLIIGVSEVSKGVAGDTSPVNLAVTRDRIDQVARNIPTPPIYVESREIPDPDRPGFGVLLVGVPGSGPHMVDQRYWGRGDQGKTPITDITVRERLARRRLAEDDVLQDVRALAGISEHPVIDGTKLPRLLLRVVPVDSRRDAAQSLILHPDGETYLAGVLREISNRRPGPAIPGSSVQRALSWGRYARGRALQYPDPAYPDEGQPGRETIIRIEDTGALDLVHGPVGQALTSPLAQVDGETAPTVSAFVVLGAVHDALALAARVAHEHTSYPGEWIVGVRIDELEGCRDSRSFQHGFAFGYGTAPAYTGYAFYESSTLTTTAELSEQPWAVAERVLTRFVRAVGAEKSYFPYEPESAAPGLLR